MSNESASDDVPMNGVADDTPIGSGVPASLSAVEAPSQKSSEPPADREPIRESVSDNEVVILGERTPKSRVVRSQLPPASRIDGRAPPRDPSPYKGLELFLSVGFAVDRIALELDQLKKMIGTAGDAASARRSRHRKRTVKKGAEVLPEMD